MVTDYIRFDWAMKRLLRNKANHAVLEGLLTSLLNEKITIVSFVEREGKKERNALVSLEQLYYLWYIN